MIKGFITALVIWRTDHHTVLPSKQEIIQDCQTDLQDTRGCKWMAGNRKNKPKSKKIVKEYESQSVGQGPQNSPILRLGAMFDIPG